MVAAAQSRGVRQDHAAAAHALAAAQLMGVPDRACEIQMLYGMADPIKEVLIGMGHRVRVYTPYGQLLPGMMMRVGVVQSQRQAVALRSMHNPLPNVANNLSGNS